LTQPLIVDGKADTHYIGASYLNWVQSAGGRAIAIPQNADNATIDALFPKLNGVLLTGGSDIYLKPDSVKRLFELTMKANEEGDVFPLWASCLGFEMLVTIFSTDDSQLESPILYKNYTSENLPLPLELTKHAKHSKVFSDSKLRDWSSTQSITMNNHENGVTPENFENDKRLSKLFTVLSTNVDRDGQPFVSTVEAKNYPIVGTQWHAEKNMFEYNIVDNGTDVPVYDIPHTMEAVTFSFEMAMYFVGLARLSSHVFTPMEDFPFIWKYPNKPGHTFEQMYLINVTKWNYGNHTHGLINPDYTSESEEVVKH